MHRFGQWKLGTAPHRVGAQMCGTAQLTSILSFNAAASCAMAALRCAGRASLSSLLSSEVATCSLW